MVAQSPHGNSPSGTNQEPVLYHVDMHDDDDDDAEANDGEHRARYQVSHGRTRRQNGNEKRKRMTVSRLCYARLVSPVSNPTSPFRLLSISIQTFPVFRGKKSFRLILKPSLSNSHKINVNTCSAKFLRKSTRKYPHSTLNLFDS